MHIIALDPGAGRARAASPSPSPMGGDRGAELPAGEDEQGQGSFAARRLQNLFAKVLAAERVNPVLGCVQIRAACPDPCCHGGGAREAGTASPGAGGGAMGHDGVRGPEPVGERVAGLRALAVNLAGQEVRAGAGGAVSVEEQCWHGNKWGKSSGTDGAWEPGGLWPSEQAAPGAPSGMVGPEQGGWMAAVPRHQAPPGASCRRAGRLAARARPAHACCVLPWAAPAPCTALARPAARQLLLPSEQSWQAPRPRGHCQEAGESPGRVWAAKNILPAGEPRGAGACSSSPWPGALD